MYRQLLSRIAVLRTQERIDYMHKRPRPSDTRTLVRSSRKDKEDKEMKEGNLTLMLPQPL